MFVRCSPPWRGLRKLRHPDSFLLRKRRRWFGSAPRTPSFKYNVFFLQNFGQWKRLLKYQIHLDLCTNACILLSYSFHRDSQTQMRHQNYFVRYTSNELQANKWHRFFLDIMTMVLTHYVSCFRMVKDMILRFYFAHSPELIFLGPS